ncbi:MAG TPA: SpoIIE family protein phosphatase [Terriglobales bacterium]|nr:SpoIIE family protein phosphatase [Terriglobales bacterium]
MRLIPLQIESRLRERGFWPQSRLAWATLYVLALDLLVFAVQFLTTRLWPSTSASLGWWETFLDWLAIVLLATLGFRWLRSHLLWRLRNRLIVTYVFIGVIPVILLLVISLITVYLFARQFAGFVVTSDVETHLHSMEASNRAIGRALANQLQRHGKLDSDLVSPVRPHRPEWARREVCVWYGQESQANCTGPEGSPVFDFPKFIAADFANVVRDRGELYLRVATIISADPETLRVATSEPIDKALVEQITGDLGQIIFSPNAPNAGGETSFPQSEPVASTNQPANPSANDQFSGTFSAGKVPTSTGSLDLQIAFPVPIQVVDWQTGERQREGALARIETRPSVLYARLFGVLGDYAKGIESILFSIAIVFAIIEIFALWIGTRLTRTITSSVADLYDATTHVNRGDFTHRIAVKSNDQLATLATSFNSMTASIERLVKEQKEKQRLENELTIAQEVQSQLFPKEISQLASLEVHGFCRPARTVSGDYYDFLKLNSQRMILAVGDISGKGISAALLMATIHSAVRAYTLEGIPLLSQPAVATGSGTAGLALVRDLPGPEVSPAALLGLLNHQLFESTPDAKYATLFLGIWDGSDGSLTYANGGHLHPILISQDGSHRLLDCSGTVVGLLDNIDFPEATVHLRGGDLLIAYSDGVTEPESDYGEFGEERLIQIVRENRHLPLERITPLVTAALDEWIGDNEQPDDVTLVLARAR